ncbi:MAG: flippase-like domain-containing protein [Acidimicrobiia bacterium]|nr:flippase-like domain-containing protein [Acidimicrobiia bacterium]MDH5519094.1 flippase-like domain-containing protein [Acidimicrobiia bacterium]
MKKRSRFVKRAIGLAVTAVSVYIVIPSVVEVFSSWPELERLRPGSLGLMTISMLLSLACFWVLYGLCLGSNDWTLMATSQLASSAIARIVPGGAATATAVQYRLLHDAGMAKQAAVTGLTVATILNFAVLFSLPVFAIPAILLGTPIAPLLLRAAVAAVIGFVAAALVSGLFFLRDRPLVLLGRSVDALARRVGRGDPSAPRRAQTFVEARDLVRSHLATNWRWIVLASLGRWGFEYLALILAVRGVGHDDIGSVLILAFVTASLLSRVPFTPGGLGFVEAGLTGTLTLAGLSPGDAVLATLAYRLVSYWLPIPVGALAYVVHSRFLRSRGVRTESLAEFGQHELESLAGGRPMIE